MRVFIHEHVTGGGLAGAPLPPSLEREGWAMLRSIVEDFSRVNEVEEVIVSLDDRLEDRAGQFGSGEIEVVLIREGRAGEVIRRLAAGSEATLVIAPETGGALLDLTLLAEISSPRVLGSSSSAVELAGDKIELAARLAGLEIPTVPLEPIDPYRPPSAAARFTFPAVLKPRFGAGSQWTWRIDSLSDLPRVLAEAREEGAPREMVIGPFVPGLAASASFLCGPGGPLPLLPGSQALSADGRFRYRGGRLPLPERLAARAVPLASRAARAVEGLRGFAGVDLVLDPSPSAAGPPRDVVIEVNPRLTTSYVGLRVLARGNLADCWLAAGTGVDAWAPEWYGDGVGFFPDGSWFREERDTS